MTNTDSFVALVDDNTPEYLEYGAYRGWVSLDAEGGWVQDLTEESVRELDIEWDEFSGEYGRSGRIRS